MIYQAQETGFAVARLSVPGHYDPIIIVGRFPAIHVGQTLHLAGYYQEHPRFGRQFQVMSAQAVQPTTLSGLEHYLGSGFIPGIGPVIAKRIVAHFGLETKPRHDIGNTNVQYPLQKNLPQQDTWRKIEEEDCFLSRNQSACFYLKEGAMFVRGTIPSWYFSQDTSEAIDFCFQVLQADGLSAPPFDRHPDGDGSLRAAGMTAESWLAWLMEVLQLQREQEQTVKQWAVARRAGVEQAVLSFDQRLQQPALAWSGIPAVGQRLQELWEQYQQDIRANRGLEKQMRETLHLRRQTEQNLWAALRPYQQRIPPLNVYLIHYAGGVDLVVPPDTVLLSDSGLDGTAERTSLLRAAAALADGGEHSWHRPVDALVEEQRAQRVEHLVAEAQQIGQAEDSDPIAAVRKELHRSHLGRYEWRMETLHVAKHKVTPESGVYCLAVQDQAGKMYTFTCEVERKPDSLWRAQSCSGGPGALPRALHPLYPIVRILLQRTVLRSSRPWLWFHGGAGVVYTADGTPKNGFRGSGEISGRKIVRVRLSDTSGELAEDTVENGLVIFRNERQMEAPVEAELYDRAGRVVRRQTVLK